MTDGARRPRPGSGFLGLLLIPAALVGLYMLLRGAGGFLITTDGLAPADAVIVLSGGGDQRVEYAADVFEQSGARTFIITETLTSGPGGTRTSALDTRTAQAAGVPAGAIYITRVDVNDTRDEARAARDAAERFSIRTLLVVTDPFHTRRAGLVFRRALAGQAEVRVLPVPGHPYRSRDWFLSLAGWEMTLREYMGLLTSW